MISIERLDSRNFGPFSLDDFIRTQPVTDVYRRVDGEYRLVSAPFVDDWPPERKREKAAVILSDSFLTYGALEEGHVVGFIMLAKALDHQRMIVDSFHVSRSSRRQGIGRMLFQRAIEEGRLAGARQLYISACSSKETIGFYLAMGCRLADEVIPALAEDEPYDLQLVYDL